jgi:integrase
MAHIRKRAGGTWQVGWREPDGSQRAKTFKTKKAASAYAAELESSLHRGLYVDPHAGRQLFGPYAEDWFAARSYEPSTVHATGSVFRVHVLGRWAAVPLGRIDHSSVQKWVTDLSRRRSAAVVGKAYRLLVGVMRSAVRDRIIAFNPCEGVQLPRLRRKDTDDRIITRTQLLVDLLPAVPVRYRALVALAGGTGMRWGECIGLRWDAVDFEDDEVHVVRVAVEVNGHVSIRPYPKSKRSRRIIPLPPFAVELLKAHGQKYLPGPTGEVFTNSAGGPLRRSLFRSRIWRPALVRSGLLGKVIELGEGDNRRYLGVWTDVEGLEQRAELPTERDAVEHVARRAGAGLRFHDLRHSYATWLVSNGVPINDAQRVMGHEQASTLLDLYTHGSADSGQRLRDLAAGDLLAEGLSDDPDGEGGEPSDSA